MLDAIGPSQSFTHETSFACHSQDAHFATSLAKVHLTNAHPSIRVKMNFAGESTCG